MDFKARQRIGPITGMAMMLISFVFWVLTWIPIVNFFFVILSRIIYSLWFRIHGARLMAPSGPHSGGFFGSRTFQILSFFMGFLPFILTGVISAFPMVIYRAVKRVRSEDTEYNNAMELAISQNQVDRIQELQLMAEEEALAEAEEYEQAEEATEVQEDIETIEEQEGEYEETNQQESGLGPIVQETNPFIELNNKLERTDSENLLLVKARRVYRTGKIGDADPNNPVIAKAFEMNQEERGHLRSFDNGSSLIPGTSQPSTPTKPNSTKNTQKTKRNTEVDNDEFDETGVRRPFEE